MKVINSFLILWSFIFYSASVSAEDRRDDTPELFNSCQSLSVSLERPESNACRYYIQGFIAGMRVTDTINSEPHSEVDSQWSSFMERAYRTRVSSKETPKQPLRLNYFCLPNDEPFKQVLNALSKPLQTIPESIRTEIVLEEKLFQRLKETYPCTE